MMISDIIQASAISNQIKDIALKVLSSTRITPAEGVILYREADTSLLALLADQVRKRTVGDYVFYNRNVHIEPTNICVYDCKFCSYSHHQSKESWELTIDEMVKTVVTLGDDITEVHIVGAVHPGRDIYYYADLIKRVHEARPSLHIKAYTAIEIEYMAQRSGLSFTQGLQLLKDAGLNSLPGGGAEIFDDAIREQICGKKSSTEAWIEIHETAHKLGIPTNATILYGHIEQFEHRIHHMELLRQLQDRTGGFNAYIPLKFKSKNNEMSYVGEVSLIEDLRNFAVSRIYLDNIAHLKAYWPMIGKEMAALSLAFGVDDLDGTINDSTKIYSLAGAGENPSLSSDELRQLILKAGRIPAERDSVYNIISEG
ncbi:MAG: CofH family radical SAM protein [Bacteroidales bacterium]|nr:CofH family radical SAM protein [Bacteroidales bacterium]